MQKIAQAKVACFQMMNAQLITEDLVRFLKKRYGRSQPHGRGNVFTFGDGLTCSINYSKLLGGHKYFFAIPNAILFPSRPFPTTKLGEFVALICGSVQKSLVLPRALIVEMLANVPTRRVDVLFEDGSYILQTTKHPKLAVTDYLNLWPQPTKQTGDADETPADTAKPDRTHVRIQWGLIRLGQAEGCSVWVPTNDRNLAYQGEAFSGVALERLPNLGFDENTRRIIQNIDVLWLSRNAIRKAFEIESTTAIYSGLLRLNDLVLSQPNIQIELFLAAARAKRDRVYSQLTRPSFQSLIPHCQFLSFEAIDDNLERLGHMPLDRGARVSGLVNGERFTPPKH